MALAVGGVWQPWLSSRCSARSRVCASPQPRLPTGSAPPLRPLPPGWEGELMQGEKWFIPDSTAPPLLFFF